MSKRSTALFIVPRMDGHGVSTVAVVKAKVNDGELLDVRAFLKVLIQAVTAWISECSDGQEAWDASSEDFNISVLSVWTGSSSLKEYLEDVGITNLSIDCTDALSGQSSWTYDTVLGAREET